LAFVADNSVIVAWFSRSQATAYTDRMFKRLRTERVHVPGLWPTEFANAMVLLERRRILRREQVAQIGAKAAQLVTNIAEPAAVPLLIEVARRHDLTAYDAAYLELAMRLSFHLASKDGPLAAAARKARLLAD